MIVRALFAEVRCAKHVGEVSPSSEIGTTEYLFVATECFARASSSGATNSIRDNGTITSRTAKVSPSVCINLANE